MSEMVERVARAMCAAAEDDWDWSVFYIVDANDTAETGREVYRDMARATIEAMREPTDAMLLADPRREMDLSEESWEAMIDAALKEGVKE